MKSPKRLMVNRAGQQPEFVQSAHHCPVKDCCSAAFPGLTYKEQLAFKTDHLKKQVQAWDATLLNTVKNCVASEATLGYRFSAKLVVQVDRRRSMPDRAWIKIGLYRPNSHDVVDVGPCPVQADNINKVVGFLRAAIAEQKISVYNEAAHTGVLRYVTFRQSHANNQLLLTFVINGKDEGNKLKVLGRDIVGRFTFVKGVLQHQNDERSNSIFTANKSDSQNSENTKLITGETTLMEELNGIRFKISATSFFQVNPFVAGAMYRRIAEVAELNATNTALDLYCGVGGIALHLAKSQAQVIGVDEVPSSIDNAHLNASDNNLKARFECGKVEEVLPRLMQTGVKKVDVVTLNPSRGGCEPQVLQAIVDLGPEKIIYMSCNTVSLLRDLDALKKQYQLLMLEPFDMFPGTKHTEVIALLIKK